MATIYNPNTMSSSEIKKMQNALIKAGYNVGSTGADGIWGKNTSAAISQFKKDTGGSNTYGNTIGNETFKKLYGTSNSSSNSSSKSGSSNNTVKWDTNDEAQKAYQNMLKTGNTEAQGIQSQWDSAAAAAENSYSNSLSNLNNSYNANVSQANMSADDAARQQYIAYMQNKNKLGEQLSAQGITGGASETALNSILNAYSTALNSNEGSRQAALADLASSYQDDLTGLNQTLNSSLADINSQYGSAYADAVNAYQSALDAAKLASDKETSINNWNTNVANRIASVKPTYVWTDDIGKLHWSNKKSSAQAAEAAGYNIISSSDFIDAHSSKSSSGSSSSSSSSSSSKSSKSSYEDIWGNSTSNKSTKSSTSSSKKTGKKSVKSAVYGSKSTKK